MDVLFRLGGQQFVWNADKAATNLVKHGIRFQEACEVLLDPLVCGEDASVEEEQREAAIGVTRNLKLLYVVHVIRVDDWIRIISARRATAQERKLYEKHHGKNS